MNQRLTNKRAFITSGSRGIGAGIVNGEFAEMMKKQFVALGRYASVGEIAGFVAYLASAEAGYLIGASLTIDGGVNA